MNLSNKELKITAEHIGHTIRFVEVVETEDPSEVGVVCAVCVTCANSPNPNDVVILSVVDSPDLESEIRTKLGNLQRCCIEPGAVQ
jgi:hypothetical protein